MVEEATKVYSGVILSLTLDLSGCMCGGGANTRTHQRTEKGLWAAEWVFTRSEP